MLMQVKSVTRMFGPKAALEDVSFSVERPGFIGIIGRSGAGKSTVLRMMNRLTVQARARSCSTGATFGTGRPPRCARCASDR